MSRFFKAFFGLAVLGQAATAFATNPQFMPGDACFPVVLTKEVAEQMANSGDELHLNYHGLSGGGFFCGSVGYREIILQDVPAEWHERIVEVYTALRVRWPRHIEQSYKANGDLDFEYETNGFVVFVQNRSLDFDKYRVGFRYNEDWMDAWPNDPELPTFAKYQPHFNGFDDVAEDWRNAKHVEALTVRFPEPDKDAAIEVERRYGRGPVVGSAKDLCLVILPEDNLKLHRLRYSKELFNEAPERFAPTHDKLIVFDSRGVWRSKREDEKKKYQIKAWNRESEIQGWPDE